MSGEINNSKRVGSSSPFAIAVIALIVFAAAIFYGFYRPYHLDVPLKSVEIKTEPSSAKILVVGDIMLDRNVRNLINKKGFDTFFFGVRDLIQNADIAVGNLEGAFTTYSSITADFTNKALQFTFDPALAPALADLGFDILGLANNHSMNFGSAGLEMTRRYIGSSGMFYYGDPNNKSEISTVITKNGITIGFVGFHEFTYSNFNNVFLEIARLRPLVDVLIVSPHWGIEYEPKATESQKDRAHQFIDDGADAVIGAHPHVIGETEIYKGKKIYYSLGNFAFDQYFSKETMEGLAVEIEVNKDDKKIDLNYKDIPIKVDREGTRVEMTTSVSF